MSGAQAPEVLHIHIDGASRGNPGEAGFGIHVADAAGDVRAELYGYLGRASNNVAEYQALLHALRWALAQGARRVRVFSDSELVVRQIGGELPGEAPRHGPAAPRGAALLRRFEKADARPRAARAATARPTAWPTAPWTKRPRSWITSALAASRRS